MDRIKSDSRFSHVLQDPRFRRVPKKERKVKIDKRFQSMFKDKRFKLKYSMDKRGRPMNHTTNEDLKKYYDLSSENSDSDDEGDEDERSNDFVGKMTTKSHQVDDSLSKYSKNSENKQKNEKRIHRTSNKLNQTNNERSESLSEDEETDTEEEKERIRIKQEHLRKLENNTEEYEPMKMKNKGEWKKNEKKVEEDCDKSDEEEDTDTENSPAEIDLARGEGNIESSDSDTSSSSECDSEDEELSHPWGELDEEAPEATDITRRLAVCNMDWDRIKANDVFVLMNSFKPPDGIINSVKIYLSEYGKERLREEDVSGPKELVEKKLSEDEQEDTEGADFHMEKLRKYQLNRLRYYYAIVECDCSNTANKIYEECEGMEYESSAVRLDLRFIPDYMTFDDEPISVATQMPDPSTYQPTLFTTTALQQAKVELTWDETDPDRLKATQKAFTEKNLDNVDVGAYLASSESESEIDGKEVGDSDDDNEVRDEKSSIAKYRALLLSIEDESEKKRDDDVEMEITWTPGLKEATEDVVKKKQEDEKELTPWDQYLMKKKKKKEEKREKKKMSKGDLSDDDLPSDVDLNDPFFKQDFGREFEKPKTKSRENKQRKSKDVGDIANEVQNAELELLLMNEENDKRHFNLKSLIKESGKGSKRKVKQTENQLDDTFEVNVNDSRFEALYTSHLFNVDPSNPQFKKTKGMDAIALEKQRRRETDSSDFNVTPSKKHKSDNSVNSKHMDPELSRLVKSVKNKAETFNRKKKRN